MNMSTNRRNFLKYLSACAGTASLFPLDTLLGMAHLQAANAPLQKFVFISFADGYPAGTWAPSTNSDGSLKMNRCTAPLQPIQENCLFINWLYLTGSPGHDGFLTQWRDRGLDAPSMDTLIAEQDAYRSGYSHPHVRAGVDTGHWGHGTRVPSQRRGRSTLTYVDSPSTLYGRLFGDKSGGQSALNQENRRKVVMLERGIGDLISMEERINGFEKEKLEAYLRELKTVRASLVRQEGSGSSSDYMWKSLSSSGGRDARAELQVQNIVLSLAIGKTRIGCLALGSTNDNMVISGVANNKPPHDTSHKLFGIGAFVETREWYMKQVYRLAYRLNRIDDANGTKLFDNTLIIVSSEMSDDHSPGNLPVILIGGKSANGTNRHLVDLGAKGKGRSLSYNAPVGALWNGMAQALDIPSPYPTKPISGVFV